MYDQFVTMVADARHMDKDAVRKLADGRAYTGRQAVQLGLVDADRRRERGARLAGQGARHLRPHCRCATSQLGGFYERTVRRRARRAADRRCWADVPGRAPGRSGRVCAPALSRAAFLDAARRAPASSHASRETRYGIQNMTKSELIAELASANPHLMSRDVELIVATIFDEITAALARGARVELRGFGAFTVKRRDARTGRNPRTGEAVPVNEKVVPFFKAGKELRERVNRGPQARARPRRGPSALRPDHARPARHSAAADPGRVRAVEQAGRCGSACGRPTCRSTCPSRWRCWASPGCSSCSAPSWPGAARWPQRSRARRAEARGAPAAGAARGRRARRTGAEPAAAGLTGPSPMAQVKICGINTPEALAAAAEAGADWVGFVFFPPSPRYVTPGASRRALGDLPGGPGRVGLFVEPTDEEVEAALRSCRARRPADLRQPGPRRRRCARASACRSGTRSASSRRADLPACRAGRRRACCSTPSRRPAPRRPGGNAAAFDWSVLRGWHAPAPGCSPAASRRTTSPTPSAPPAPRRSTSPPASNGRGVKDPALIRAFIEAAKRAGQDPRKSGSGIASRGAGVAIQGNYDRRWCPGSLRPLR